MQINDAQRRLLGELLHWALLEIRMLGYLGKAEQAADLADAFHNLPKDMWKEDFTLEYFRGGFLDAYQQKYPGASVQDYVARVNAILALGEDPASN